MLFGVAVILYFLKMSGSRNYSVIYLTCFHF
jgi:hypothetical protein